MYNFSKKAPSYNDIVKKINEDTLINTSVNTISTINTN
jgi:hypothetical protein